MQTVPATLLLVALAGLGVVSGAEWLGFQPVDSVCRGDSPGDNSEAYYTVHNATSLEACQQLCVNAVNCTGIEHWGLQGRCEVWTRQIGALEFSPGFVCLRYVAPPPIGAVEQDGATVPVGGELGLYAIGSSNVPWNTWPDQLHLELQGLGYSMPVIPTQHPDTILHPISVPVCDDAAAFSALSTPRIGKIGWASWGFAFENTSDCNAEGFRPILNHMVGCTNAWACNPAWVGEGASLIRPSEIAEDARHSQVTVLSNWINDSKQRHAQNVCYHGEAIDPVATTDITLFNLRRVIRAIHDRNPAVVVAVLGLYPDSDRTGYIVEDTLPLVAAINAAVQQGLQGEPNTVFVNYTFPAGEAMFQTKHPGHPNCRGDKVIASSIIEALFRAKVLARGLALGDVAGCLPSSQCGSLTISCCQRAALCRVKDAVCVAYSPGEQ